MSKIAVATKRFSGFMKRNAMYLLILLCIASVATVIALAATGNFGEQSINIDGEQNNNDNTDIAFLMLKNYRMEIFKNG